jgi:hypothetical protein
MIATSVRIRRRGRALAAAILVAVLSLLVPAAPVCAEPTPADKALAAKRFREAMRLFKLKEFRRAAEIFEEAYGVAPHPDALLNAMDAYEQAGELALAAEVSSRLLADVPEGSARSIAERRLTRLAPKLGRLRLSLAPGGSDVRVNGAPAREGDRWVDPGSHLVEAKYGQETVSTRVQVGAGAVAEVKLEAPKAPPPEPPKDEKEEPWPRPIHPGYFFGGVGLSVLSTSLLIWSGVDTIGAREDFDRAPTREGLEDGQFKQARSNVLVATTTIFATATALVGAFGVDWTFGASKESEVPQAGAARVLLSPFAIGVEGVY